MNLCEFFKSLLSEIQGIVAFLESHRLIRNYFSVSILYHCSANNAFQFLLKWLVSEFLSCASATLFVLIIFIIIVIDVVSTWRGRLILPISQVVNSCECLCRINPYTTCAHKTRHFFLKLLFRTLYCNYFHTLSIIMLSVDMNWYHIFWKFACLAFFFMASEKQIMHKFLHFSTKEEVLHTVSTQEVLERVVAVASSSTSICIDMFSNKPISIRIFLIIQKKTSHLNVNVVNIEWIFTLLWCYSSWWKST